MQCSSCDAAANLSVSLDRSSCLPCDAATHATYNATSLQCDCDAANQYLADSDDGKSCNPCPASHALSPSSGNRYECELCEPPKVIDASANHQCRCPATHVSTESGNGCVSQTNATFIASSYNLADAKEITFVDIDSSQRITVESSDLLEHYFLSSAVQCKLDGDTQSCQALANLCVLSMYQNRTQHRHRLLVRPVGDIQPRHGRRRLRRLLRSVPVHCVREHVLSASNLRRQHRQSGRVEAGAQVLHCRQPVVESRAPDLPQIGSLYGEHLRSRRTRSVRR